MKNKAKPGRVAVGVRVYNTDGAFIQKFESIRAAGRYYYPEDIGIRPILTKRKTIFSNYKGEKITLKYGIINNEYYIFDQTVNRDDVRHIHAIENSSFCVNKLDTDRVVEIYNINDEKIGEVISQNILTKLLPHISQGTINKQLREGFKRKRTSGMGEELIFKYKKDENTN